MTVAELIEKLREFSPEQVVYVEYDGRYAPPNVREVTRNDYYFHRAVDDQNLSYTHPTVIIT